MYTTGIAGITRQAGETDAGFKARQQAARAFTTRQQNLAGIAPTVAGQDALQQEAQTLAQQGVGSFEPFLTEQNNKHKSWIRNTGSTIRWNWNWCYMLSTTIYVSISINK